MDTLVSIFEAPFFGQPFWMWGMLVGIVVLLLAFDLGVLNRKDHEIGVRESLNLTALYIFIAIVFGAWVWWEMGADDGMDYFTAYVVEKSLSVDNLFVISLIFAYYGIPRQYQHRVLFWGILGVIVMRGIMIAGGAALVQNFDFVLLLFAAFLMYTGYKLLTASDEEDGKIEDSRFVKFLQKHLQVTPFLHGNKFFIRQKGLGNPHGRLQATPLFLALVTVEVADLIFAVDSVPAVLAITTNTFVVYASNIFAIIGLRAMYFAVAAIIHRFIYMKYALAVILIFIGGKAFYAHFTHDKVPAVISLGLTLGTLLAGFIFSMIKTNADARQVARMVQEQRKRELE